jgi:hypothetical protein
MSGLEKPLFNIVMAVASQQLSLLNDNRFNKDIWIYRGKALRRIQTEIVQFQTQQERTLGELGATNIYASNAYLFRGT